MTVDDAYHVLGLEPGADAAAAQKAYRRRALEYHPDRAGSPEEASAFTRRFMEVRDAYELLRAEGFPMPDAEEAVADILPGGWTAERRFARAAPEEAGELEKLGLSFAPDMKSIAFWLVFIPASAAFVAYVIRTLWGLLRGG